MVEPDQPRSNDGAAGQNAEARVATQDSRPTPELPLLVERVRRSRREPVL